MSRVEVSTSDLFDALEKAAAHDVTQTPPGFFVVSDMVRATGKCPRTIREKIRLAEERGKVEKTEVWRRRTDGRVSPVVAYRIKD